MSAVPAVSHVVSMYLNIAGDDSSSDIGLLNSRYWSIVPDIRLNKPFFHWASCCLSSSLGNGLL